MSCVRVVFDVRMLVRDPQPSGIPYYAMELIRHLDGAVDLQTIGDTPEGPAGLPGCYHFVPRRRGWQQLHLPRVLSRFHSAIFHSTHFTLPVLAPLPMVVTVHDLSWWHMAGLLEQDTRRYLRRWGPWAIRRARCIITPTEYVRREVIGWFHVDPERVAVTPYGVGEPFTPARAPEEVSPRPWPYILAVSTLEPRKNLARLLTAFGCLVKDEPDMPHHLVLVGRPTAEAGRLEALTASLGLRGRVEMTGYITRGEVVRLYRHAALLAYPSLYEGFGLPILEAMASGCPVVAGGNSGMAEVVGDAGILVDAADVDDIARGVRTALGPGHGALRAAGIARAAAFSWERTARTTVEVYRRVAARAGMA